MRLLVDGLGHDGNAVAHVGDRIEQAASRGSNLIVLVAEVDEAVAGVAGVTISTLLEYARPQARITAVAVDAAARRLGIGRALVAAAEDEARRRGCFRIELTSANHLIEAHAFWRHIGYDAWGARFGRVL